MIKRKEFKSPTQEPVRVLSQNGMIISWVYPEWTDVREELWRDAYSKGCVSKDMNRVGLDPLDGIAHQQAMEKAFNDRVLEVMKELIEEGDPDKLDALGRPKVEVIDEIIGERPTASLRNKLFLKLTKK
jgi:hypothetical protein